MDDSKKGVNMDRSYIFKEGDLTFIITELGKLPYNQVCRIINFIDHIATKQIQNQNKPIDDQIQNGIVGVEE